MIRYKTPYEIRSILGIAVREDYPDTGKAVYPDTMTVTVTELDIQQDGQIRAEVKTLGKYHIEGDGGKWRIASANFDKIMERAMKLGYIDEEDFDFQLFVKEK